MVLSFSYVDSTHIFYAIMRLELKLSFNRRNSELLMPMIDTRGHSYDEFLSAIERQGYYEIKNPSVYKPGTNEIEQVEGIFRINQWSK